MVKRRSKDEKHSKLTAKFFSWVNGALEAVEESVDSLQDAMEKIAKVDLDGDCDIGGVKYDHCKIYDQRGRIVHHHTRKPRHGHGHGHGHHDHYA
jgi:hypothetical protein